MENAFYNTVEHIFSNWTALILAVEHGMAGSNGKEVALDCIKYMTQYCLNEPNLQVEDIQEAIEDIMDQEFTTICEDESPKEIAALLHRFLQLLKEGDLVQYETEHNKLPTNKDCLLKSRQQPQPRCPAPANEEAGTSSTANDEEMETVDSEWTEVKGRRKR